MAEPDAQQTPEAAIAEPAPALIPDYCLSPNAVFADQGVQWRYGRAPDYTNTRGVWAEGTINRKRQFFVHTLWASQKDSYLVSIA